MRLDKRLVLAVQALLSVQAAGIVVEHVLDSATLRESASFLFLGLLGYDPPFLRLCPHIILSVDLLPPSETIGHLKKKNSAETPS